VSPNDHGHAPIAVGHPSIQLFGTVKYICFDERKWLPRFGANAAGPGTRSDSYARWAIRLFRKEPQG